MKSGEAWRAEKTTELIGEISRALERKNPELRLNISLGLPYDGEGEVPGHLPFAGEKGNAGSKHLDATDPAFDAEKLLLNSYSLDLSSIQEFPNVQTAAMRHYLHYRWQRHWNNRETIHNDVLYRAGLWQPFRKNGQAPVWSFAPYFESFNDSLKPEVYASYFQTADVKPWGRYFLKEWAFSLAEFDSHELLLGGQPIGTLGREEVVREFARAYRALPAEPFDIVPGVNGPVTARSLQTENGTYLYFVNVSWSFP